MLLRDHGPTPQYEVLWDGSPKTSRQLFAAEETRVQPASSSSPLQVQDGKHTERVLAALTIQADTMRGVSERLAMDRNDVDGAIYHLRRKGRLKVIGVREIQEKQRKAWGRSTELVYGVPQEQVS
jgi:hypothetical protein